MKPKPPDSWRCNYAPSFPGAFCLGFPVSNAGKINISMVGAALAPTNRGAASGGPSSSVVKYNCRKTGKARNQLRFRAFLMDDAPASFYTCCCNLTRPGIGRKDQGAYYALIPHAGRIACHAGAIAHRLYPVAEDSDIARAFVAAAATRTGLCDGEIGGCAVNVSGNGS